jgi:hypothetical protein
MKTKVISARRVLALVATAVLAGVFVVAANAAAPQSTSPPTIEGKFQVGETLTASNGLWSNSPTSFTYQWQRCSSSGSSCADIDNAAQKTYKLVSADVDHTVRVLVTAANADGKATANSHPSPVISDSSAPRNTARPVISGKTEVGETLTASNGTWTGGATTFTYQWQRCDENGSACVNVAGATSKTYGVRSADQGNTMRALVTAANTAGKTTVNTDRTAVIEAAPGSTVVVTTTQAVNHAPAIRFLMLKVHGTTVFTRFRVCDDSFSKVTVLARAQMPLRLAYTRRFAVYPASCATVARHWTLIPRFRHHGRYVVSLRAIDKSHRLSVLVSRAVRI